MRIAIRRTASFPLLAFGADPGISRPIRRGGEARFTLDNATNRGSCRTRNYFVPPLRGQKPMVRIHAAPGCREQRARRPAGELH